MPYNLTFDNPYNRDVVRKLDNFRNKQQGYYLPANIEPEHITHQYDPITITGGSFNPNDYNAPMPSSRITSNIPYVQYCINLAYQWLALNPSHAGSYGAFEGILETFIRLLSGNGTIRDKEINLDGMNIPDFNGSLPDDAFIQRYYGMGRMCGGSFSGGASSYHAVSRRIEYPTDLFEPRYTLNRNQMLGNRLKGGSSDFYNEPFYAPVNYNSGTSFDRKDNLINDLGAIHSKRRGRRAMIGMDKEKSGGDLIDDLKTKGKKIVDKIKTKVKGIDPSLLDKLKKFTGGKKQKKEKKEPTSKLLKIFN
jgi:hypothetical protein